MRRACVTTRFADRRERDEAGGAFDQRHAEGFLEFPELAAEGWLRDATALRRAAEVAQVRDGDQIAQFGECHGRAIPFTPSIGEIASLDWTNEPRLASLMVLP